MNEVLTDEMVLLNAIKALMESGALKSKTYTDRTVDQAKVDLRAELAGLTGINKDKLDALTALLDRSDLNEDGTLNLDTFMQSISATIADQATAIAENKTATKQNATDLATYQTANNARVSAVETKNSEQDTAIATANSNIAKTNAVATSSQNAIAKLNDSVASIQGAVDAIYAGTTEPTDPNAL